MYTRGHFLDIFILRLPGKKEMTCRDNRTGKKFIANKYKSHTEAVHSGHIFSFGPDCSSDINACVVYVSVYSLHSSSFSFSLSV